MKKASKILFLVGGILTIFAAIGFVILAGFSFYAVAVAEEPDAPQWVIKLVNDLIAEGSTKEQALAAITLVGAVFIVQFILSIPCAVLAFVTSGKDKRGLGLLIVSTVFATLAWSPVCLVGGVLGIVSWSTVERKEREAQAQ